MATDILIKRSTTGGAVPTTGDLSTGELAVNTVDKRLFTNNGGTIVEIGTAPTSLAVTNNTTVGGTLGVTGDTTVADGEATNWTVTGTLTVPTPSNNTDAASKAYVDTADALKLDKAGDTMSGNLAMGTNKVTGLGTPTDSTDAATKGYVDAQVTAVIDSAPGALDTLNELAAAINDDANFATTVTNALAGKLALAGGTMTGNIVMGANAVTSTATPATDDTLTRKGYVDTQDATKLNLSGGIMTGDIALGANKATSTATPTTDDTLTRKGYVDSILGSATDAATSADEAAASASAAATSESNASTSETNAATSASNASDSADAAASSATSASNSATSAGNSATAASNSASAAATSATNAENAYDSFDDRYLGAKSSDPSVDNDGDALIEGALYFNSTDDEMRVYTGSAWVAVKDLTGSVAITGGTIDDTTIGGSTPAAGSFTTLDATGNVDFTGGDISFYEDTGTTPKLFWDASAERLGIGTASPTGKFESFISSVRFGGFHGANGDLEVITNNNTNPALYVKGTGSADLVNVFDGTTEVFTILNGGNVGIGTTSPAGRLEVSAGTNLNAVFKQLSMDNAANEGIGIELTRTTSDSALSAIGITDTDKLTLASREGLHFYTGGSSTYSSTIERMRLDKDGNVGIGTSSPDRPLEVVATNTTMKVSGTGVSSTGIVFETNGVERKQIGIPSGDTALAFYSDAGSSEAMRIDNSGNLLVGTTVENPSATADDSGIALRNTGRIDASGTSVTALSVNRNSTDGNIAEFRKGGSTVGSIGTAASTLNIKNNQSVGSAGLRFGFGYIRPIDKDDNLSDNALDLGQSNARFDDIYATNGTIQTSDRNEKQDIEALSEAEKRVAVAAKRLLRKFRWKSAVEEKGDDARIHFGIIAQDLQAAFEAEGLDAGRYAMFIHSTWWEVEETYTDDEGVEQARINTYDTAEEAPEGATERTRLGVRYSELLAFIIAAI